MEFEIINGNCLRVLREFARDGRKFDALVADPPYCSGGTSAAGMRGGVNKYVSRKDLGDFGDGMTTRAFYRFSVAWLEKARAVMKPTGYAFVFIDWRMLPTLSDAFQIAGFYWRGLAVWDKGMSRLIQGQLPHNAEYVLWGTTTNEKSDKWIKRNVFYATPPNASQKIHPTQKSSDMIAELLAVLPDAASDVLDPFCGSGATGVAALGRGMNFTGIDSSPEYCEVARGRLQTTLERFQATGEVVDAHRAQRTLWEPLAGRETA